MRNQNEKNSNRSGDELLKQAYEAACGETAGEKTEKAMKLLGEAVERLAEEQNVLAGRKSKYPIGKKIADQVAVVFKKKYKVLDELIKAGISAGDACSFYLSTQISGVCERCGITEGYYTLLDKAAECGSAQIKYIVGMQYLDKLKDISSEYAPQFVVRTGPDEITVKTKGSCFVREAAELGFSQAQCVYYLMCRRQLTGNEDLQEGIEYLRQAAESGYAPAQRYLGKMKLSGPEPGEGASWLKKAAQQGDAEAMFALGKFYLGVPEEKKESVLWLKKAAAKGDPRAKWLLTTHGIEQYDMRRTVEQLFNRASAGDHFAGRLLNYMSSNPDRFTKFGVVAEVNPENGSVSVSYALSGDGDEDHSGAPLPEGSPEADSDNGEDPDDGNSYPERLTFAWEAEYEAVILFRHKVIFTDVELDRETVPEGYYCYEIRGEDVFQSRPCRIGNEIMFNPMGTVITNMPITLDENGFRDISRRKSDWKKTDDWMTLEEYMQEYPPSPAS